VSQLFMDNWIHKIANNNKIGITQAKCLIKVNIERNTCKHYACYLSCLPKNSKNSKKPQNSYNSQIKEFA